jgi:hypothetical protein
VDLLEERTDAESLVFERAAVRVDTITLLPRSSSAGIGSLELVTPQSESECVWPSAYQITTHCHAVLSSSLSARKMAASFASAYSPQQPCAVVSSLDPPIFCVPPYA